MTGHKSFGSDNHTGAHPAVLDAIVAANSGDAVAYGADEWTERVTAALSLGVFSTASVALIVMLCLTTAARSVLWTVSYPLAAAAAERRGIGLGAAVGLLNGIWAATAVLGPLAAGLAAEDLGGRVAFGLTEAACAAALAVTLAAAAGRGWLPARRAAGPSRLAVRRAARRGPVPDPPPADHATQRVVP